MSLFDTAAADDVEQSPPELPPNESSADPMVNPLSDPIVDPVNDPLSPTIGVDDLGSDSSGNSLSNHGVDTPLMPDDTAESLSPTDFDEGTPL